VQRGFSRVLQCKNALRRVWHFRATSRTVKYSEAPGAWVAINGTKKAGRPKGYFYRTGRGWYSKESARFLPLRFEDGTHIKDEKVDSREVQEAFARFLLNREQTREVQRNRTVFEVCERYLTKARISGALKTHADRANTLRLLLWIAFRSTQHARSGGVPQQRHTGASATHPRPKTRTREAESP